MTTTPARSPSDEPRSEAEHLALAALTARGLPFGLESPALQAFETRFNAIPAMVHMGCALDLSTPPVIRVDLPEVQSHHRGGIPCQSPVIFLHPEYFPLLIS